MTHQQEIDAGARFQFGRNWSSFLELLNDDRIVQAEKSFRDLLGVQSLTGRTFIDVGSGSGLFSLAARRLGAKVHSFDYDPQSKACTAELHRRYFPADPDWKVEEGSVLDDTYIRSLGQYDIVYSWGVLHHTGQMWKAISNAASLCKPGGTFFIAIYNYMGGASRRWTWIKRTYCRLPAPLRLPFALAVITPIQLRSFAIHLVQGKAGAFIAEKRNYLNTRGMNWWYDQIDWIGGYPYEDAKPEEVFDFVKRLGFRLERLTTHGGGIGCNEFVFTRRDG